MLSALANIWVLSKSIDVTNGLGTLRLQVNLITDSIFLATPMLGPCLSDDGIPLPPKAHGALRRQRRTPRWQQDRGGPPLWIGQVDAGAVVMRFPYLHDTNRTALRVSRSTSENASITYLISSSVFHAPSENRTEQ